MKWLKKLLGNVAAKKIEDLEFKLLLVEGELKMANAKLKAAELKLQERRVEEVNPS